MTAIVICFLVGILLLAAEIIVPGGVLGTAGGIAMLAGVVLAFTYYGGSGGSIATLVSLVALGVTVYLELIWLPQSRLAKQLSVSAANEGTSQPAIADEAAVIGREATAQTTLAPTGYVLVEGRRYEAYSRSGYVNAGEKLRVVGLDNFRLIVSKT